jgi:predicted ATPase
VQVLAGACIGFVDGGLPYAPLLAALRPALLGSPPEELSRLLSGHRAELAVLLPELTEPGTAQEAAPDADTATPMGRQRLFALLAAVLSRLAERSPVVLVVEDLHWADRSSLEFLAYLAASLDIQRLTLVASYRHDEVDPGHPLSRWLTERRRDRRVTEIELARFTRVELAAQLRAILDAPPTSVLVDEVYARSDGNAYFAEMLLAARQEGTTQLPTALRDLVLDRSRDLAGTRPRRPGRPVGRRRTACHGRRGRGSA